MSTPIKGIFVSGTDPGVGQTLVASALAAALFQRGLRVAVMKPVETGCALRPDATTEVDGMSGAVDAQQLAALQRLAGLAGPPPAGHIARVPHEALLPRDAPILRELSGCTAALDLVSPYRYAPAVVPAVAARLAQRPVEITHLRRCLEQLAADADLVVVEGLGGLMVPIASGLLLIDVVAQLELPTLLVSSTEPNTINHCLLSIEALARRDLPCCGVVLNRLTAAPPRPEEAANPEQIEAFAGDVVRGCLPYLSEQQRADRAALAQRLRVHVDIDALLAAGGLYSSLVARRSS